MRHTTPPHRSAHFPLFLLAAFVAIWSALAIAPTFRQDWLLENGLVMAAVPLLVYGYRRLRLSNAAYLALFVFFVFHEIGAHYTYSAVPYERWLSHLDMSLAWLGRNSYDRLVHFLYGLLVTPAAAELLAAVAPARGIWRWILPVSFIMSHSLLYELIEWAAAMLFGGDLGVAYLGTQGDPWDAQHDMLAATLGGMTTMTVLWVARRGPFADHATGIDSP